MTNYVLVHGAWHGGWCWRKVANRLRDAGHLVFTPTLTGLGQNSHQLTRDVNLSTHVTDITNLLKWEELEDVVLCGHSYGGMVVTGAADLSANRIKSLVYLDAFVPEDGKKLFDYSPPDRKATQIKAAEEMGDGWRVPAPDASLWTDDPGHVGWLNGLVTEHPLACMTEPVRVTGAIENIQNKHYILAADFIPSPFHGFYDALKDDPDWKTHSLPTTHDVMVTMPSELTELLLAAAHN